MANGASKRKGIKALFFMHILDYVPILQRVRILSVRMRAFVLSLGNISLGL